MYPLVSYVTDESTKLGVRTPAGTILAPAELGRWPDMLTLLDDWDGARVVLESLQLSEATEVVDAVLVAPIHWPRKVICAGVNYQKHIKEMGGEIPTEGWYPFFFLKPPTTTVIGPFDPIVLHDGENARYDWEAELGVIIGTGGRSITPDRALEHVAGYCVVNDVTARGKHKRSAVPAPPFVYDWFSSKAIDGSLPMGPGITPAFFVRDPQDLRLELWVNDVRQQHESTADMICSIADLISVASDTVTLEPGDVIVTGTPSGVGAGQGKHLRAGDVVRVTVEGLGEICNVVVDAADAVKGNNPKPAHRAG